MEPDTFKEVLHEVIAQEIKNGNLDIKELTKAAFKELLDDYVKQFGWWSLKSIGVLVVIGILSAYFYFSHAH